MLSRSTFVPALAVVAASFAVASQAQAVTIYGITGTNSTTLVSFDSATPSVLSNGFAISGLQNNEVIRDIDYRPADGQVYALGSTGRIYTLNLSNGAASFVSTVSVPLNGSQFGIDFNPVPNALRIVSNAAQNLRITGPTLSTTVVDGTLSAGVSFAAYTENFAGSTATTLFDIRTSNDTLVRQDPPNTGTLTLVGALGVNVGAVGGFDIFTPTPGTNIAYAALTPVNDSVTNLYTINLDPGIDAGKATFVGEIDSGTLITAITVVPVPEPTSLGLLGLGAVALLRRKR